MECQNPTTGNCFLGTTSYISYFSPHYIYANGSWTDSFQISQHPVSEVRQMHNIRFPTPPTTPPKDPAGSSKRPQPVSGYNQRTQSVIMKIGQCENTCQNLYEIEDVYPTGIINRRTPGKSSNFICHWINCKRCFENLENLADHVNKVHAIAATEDGLYYCQWDGCSRFDRGFNARYKMLVHVRTHTKEKPHHCHLCDKCFSRAENLKIHIRSHSGEKPYTCTYEGCQKAYSNSSDRFKHTRTHSMEKPYLCKVPGCQKRYTDPSSLRKHIKTFKHAEQLINSASSSLDSIFESKDTTHNGYCVDSTDNLYIDVDDQNCCLNMPKSRLENSWISDTVTQYSHKKIFFGDMNLGIELPLDLRINRLA